MSGPGYGIGVVDSNHRWRDPDRYRAGAVGRSCDRQHPQGRFRSQDHQVHPPHARASRSLRRRRQDPGGSRAPASRRSRRTGRSSRPPTRTLGRGNQDRGVPFTRDLVLARRAGSHPRQDEHSRSTRCRATRQARRRLRSPSYDNGRPHKALVFGGPGQRNGVEGGTQFLESIRRLKREFADVEVPVHVHSYLTTYPVPSGGTVFEPAQQLAQPEARRAASIRGQRGVAPLARRGRGRHHQVRRRGEAEGRADAGQVARRYLPRIRFRRAHALACADIRSLSAQSSRSDPRFYPQPQRFEHSSQISSV